MYGDELADVVVPISLAISGTQLTRELSGYKYNGSPTVRKEFAHNLASALATFLASHERCLAATAGVERFDLVTIAPGTRQRNGQHPLAVILGKTVMRTSGRFVEVMSATGGNDHRTVRPESVTVHADVSGRHILLVDDTWTSGASLQSAAITLERARAGRVAGLVIGRRLDADDASAAGVLRFARDHQFGWDVCVLCGTA
ncbi:hypothetical protein [Saccharothrix variisporea]|uniref:Phosphoribosyltransferase n=1 Tax=Saccharothrix variisporea TaxID=543527 RepID=A0A495XEE2_9PSEU|nr:hypothetical protein [Saccharothrix variisporea]RKT71616.1 hypothetical protein DFJ66_4909 [Saccharothrix variisporea]